RRTRQWSEPSTWAARCCNSATELPCGTGQVYSRLSTRVCSLEGWTVTESIDSPSTALSANCCWTSVGSSLSVSSSSRISSYPVTPTPSANGLESRGLGLNPCEKR